jgi:pyridoxamine 5'-phosphate oxidase-like protein
MTRAELLAFMRSERLAVEATAAPSGAPQAAVVGIAVTDDFEVVFDTLDTTRKLLNIRKHPRVALVIGGIRAGEERTVQFEGIADEPSGSELEQAKRIYFGAFPEGREREAWPGLAYVRVRPIWIRYCDYDRDGLEIIEWSAEQLRALL